MPENALRMRHLHDHAVRAGQASPPCPQRADLDQDTPAGMRPCQKLCVACGRVTARRAVNGNPWCGGEPLTPEQLPADISPAQLIGGV